MDRRPYNFVMLTRTWSDAERAHLVLRITLGVNVVIHGLVRIGHSGSFADAMVRDFATTPLPGWSVWAFGAVIPTAELVIGLAILLGAQLRAALFLGGLLIAALVLGTCLRQQWEVVGIQMLYALIYFALAARAGDARFSIDQLLAPRSEGS